MREGQFHSPQRTSLPSWQGIWNAQRSVPYSTKNVLDLLTRKMKRLKVSSIHHKERPSPHDKVDEMHEGQCRSPQRTPLPSVPYSTKNALALSSILHKERPCPRYHTPHRTPLPTVPYSTKNALALSSILHKEHPCPQFHTPQRTPLPSVPYSTKNALALGTVLHKERPCPQFHTPQRMPLLSRPCPQFHTPQRTPLPSRPCPQFHTPQRTPLPSRPCPQFHTPQRTPLPSVPYSTKNALAHSSILHKERPCPHALAHSSILHKDSSPPPPTPHSAALSVIQPCAPVYARMRRNIPIQDCAEYLWPAFIIRAQNNHKEDRVVFHDLLHVPYVSRCKGTAMTGLGAVSEFSQCILVELYCGKLLHAFSFIYYFSRIYRS